MAFQNSMAANIHGLTIHTWSGIPWKDTGDEGRDKPAEIDQLVIQWDPRWMGGDEIALLGWISAD